MITCNGRNPKPKPCLPATSKQRRLLSRAKVQAAAVAGNPERKPRPPQNRACLQSPSNAGCWHYQVQAAAVAATLNPNHDHFEPCSPAIPEQCWLLWRAKVQAAAVAGHCKHLASSSCQLQSLAAVNAQQCADCANAHRAVCAVGDASEPAAAAAVVGARVSSRNSNTNE
jgi:hypothetical protein